MASGDCRNYTVISYNDGILQQREDPVVVEHELAVFLDRCHFITLLCTPRSLPELVVGFLHAEGLIAARSDVLDVRIDDRGARADVALRCERREWGAQTRTVTTAGGAGGKTLQPGDPCGSAECATVAVRLNAASICLQMETFSRQSELFLRTGGAHACALSDGREILLFEDDIGRHNAMDKIIGHTLLQEMPLEGKLVLTTGRVSSEIVAKVARRGLSAIVSRSAPTSRAIDLARRLGMTLIGFARGRSLNVYANFSCLNGD